MTFRTSSWALATLSVVGDVYQQRYGPAKYSAAPGDGSQNSLALTKLNLYDAGRRERKAAAKNVTRMMGTREVTDTHQSVWRRLLHQRPCHASIKLGVPLSMNKKRSKRVAASLA